MLSFPRRGHARTRPGHGPGRTAQPALEALRRTGARPRGQEAGLVAEAACPSRAATPAGCRPSTPLLAHAGWFPLQTPERSQVRAEPGAGPPPGTPHSRARPPADAAPDGAHGRPGSPLGPSPSSSGQLPFGPRSPVEDPRRGDPGASTRSRFVGEALCDLESAKGSAWAGGR